MTRDGGGEADPGEGTLRERLAAHRVYLEAKDGERYLLRPIRTSDAPSVIRGFNVLSPQQRWFRFLHEVPELTAEAAAAFCTPDPDLDICLVLEGRGALAGDIVGGARITGEPRREVGEFSVSMRPEMQGLGLARQALLTALEAAAEAGYRRVFGVIAARNFPMLRLAERLGFSVRFDPDEPAQRIAEIELLPGGPAASAGASR